MADRMQQYADWLIANQNKKGTPEFDKVAQAYAQMRQSSTPATAAPQSTNYVDMAKNLGTGMLDRVYAIGEGITDFMPTVNKALTGYENPRLYLPTGDDGFQFSDLKNMRMMDEKDLPAGNVNPLGFTGKEFENAADYLAKNREALNYKPLTPWNEVKSNPTPQNVLAFMGEAAVTSLPDMAASLLSAPAYFMSYVSPIAEERAKNDGRTQVTPEDLGVAAVAALGISQAERFGAKGVFGQNAGNVAQRVVGAGAREAGTESIQNPLQYAAETAGTEKGFDPAQALDEAAAGAVGGFGAGTGLRTGTEVATAGGLTAPEDTEAAGDLARRMDANKNRNPKNVSQSMDTGGARALLDDAHIDISTEISAQEQLLRSRLKIDPKTDSEADIRLKNLAKAGIRAAKNKTKSTATDAQMNAVEQLVGDTQEGQTLLARMREGDELTRLHNQGLKGGLSRLTDKVNPLSFGEGYATKKLVEGAGKAALYGGAFTGAGPLGPAALAGIAGAGRVIDGLTGKRSNVANYIKQNRDNTGVRETQSPSLRAALQEPKMSRAERNFDAEAEKEAYEQNLPITNDGSPAAMVAQDTSLDRRQQVAIAEDMLTKDEYKRIHKRLEQLIKSIKGTYQQVDNINTVITRMEAERRKQGIEGNNPMSGGIPRITIPVYPEGNPLDAARRQQGIDDNRARIDTLRRQVAGDQDISANDRSLVEDALRDLTLDLGRNPVEAAERIVNGAAALADNKGNVTKYLNKYLDRVRQQQSGKKSEASDGALIEETNAAQLPFEPFLTEELMGRPLDEREIQYNEMDRGIYELRNQLERMQMRAGEGILSNRKKSSDIGNQRIDFDPRKVSEYRKTIIDKAVASLDPEGRELMSDLQVGLNGDGGMTNEQIAILVPSLVRAIEFMSGAQASKRGAYGRYAKTMSPAGNFMRNRIEVADINEIVDGFEKSKMHTELFLDTLLHEVGHAIGDRSNLDQLVKDTVLLGKLDPDESYYNLMEQLTKVSKTQRRDLWESLDDTLTALQQRTGYYLGPALTTYQLKLDRDGDVEELTNQVQQRAMAEGQILELDKIPSVMQKLASHIRYLNDPRELVADAVSYYLQKPKQMKELYPDLAKVIRKGVNESSLQQFITFHSLAGLLGVAGLQALLLGMSEEDEEDKGILSLSSGSLSSAA